MTYFVHHPHGRLCSVSKISNRMATDTSHITFYIFITGLGCKHIYQKNGDPSHISELLESFKKDARSVKLRAGKHQLEDVTSVLKSFLSDIDDALLTKELYPYWVSTLGNKCPWVRTSCLPSNLILRIFF